MSVRVSGAPRLEQPSVQDNPIELPLRVDGPAFHIAERKLLLATIDGLLVIAAIVAASPLQWVGLLPAAQAWPLSWGWTFAAAATWVLLSWLAGGYELSIADDPGGTAAMIVGVAVVSASLAALVALVPDTPFGLSALWFALATIPITVLGWRAVYVWTLARCGSAIRLLVVGDEAIYQELCRVVPAAERYYLIVGFISRQTGGGAGYLGELTDLVPLVARMKAHRIVVSPDQQLTGELVTALCHCATRGISVMSFGAAYEEIASKAPIERAEGGPLLPVPVRSRGSGVAEAALRCLDLAGALAGLAVAAVLTPAVAVAIVLETGRPVLYRQERLGEGGTRFVMYKFRSMRCDAERQGAMFAVVRDPRVTHVGKLLRQTHFDELPQFWNVLRGEMSLVGPRPERPEFGEQLAGVIPLYRLRLAVRPGLTGLTQIRVGYASTITEHVEVLRHDLYYIRHRSLLLNLTILARTVAIVVGRKGR